VPSVDGEKAGQEASLAGSVAQEPGRVVSDWAEQGGGDDEGDPEAFHTVAEEAADPLPCDGRPYEQSGNDEHEGHEEDVVPAHKGVERGEADGVHDRRRGFHVMRRIVMTERVVGQCGMMGDDGHRYGASQVVDRNVPFQSVSPYIDRAARRRPG